MQAYPAYGFKQEESYMYVEEEDFMKGNFYYDSGSSMQMMRPNQCSPTPPHNHHALPHHGGFDKDQHHDSWKMDKASHGGGWSSDKEQQRHHDGRKMDKPSHGGGWSSDTEQQHHHHDSWKMDKPSHGGGWSSDKGQHHHHDSWKMDKPSHKGGWLNNKEQQHHHDSGKMYKPSHGGNMHDGGSKYENSNDMHHSKMGGVDGGHHHGALVVNDDCNPRPYCNEQKSVQYWMSKGIDD